MSNELTTEEQKRLLQLAHDAIIYGVKHGIEMDIDPAAFGDSLIVKRATFVTLHLHHQLRGCIGTLAACQPLAKDVAHNAYAAAFLDPRFPPVTEDEANLIDIQISVLNPSEEMHFSSEQALLAQLRPNVDGLILSEGNLCGTFLPSVWESLKTPQDFLQHLKLKAGLPANYWSDTIKIKRYTTSSFSDH